MIIMHLDLKACMSTLLLTDKFDHLLLLEGEITTFNTFRIDGYLQKDFLCEEITELYSRWSTLREYCLSLIRGKQTPLRFSFVFALPREEIQTFVTDSAIEEPVDNVQGLYLNLSYDGTDLRCTTGTFLKTFSLDKTVEKEWDKKAQQLFTNWQIDFDCLS